MYTVYLIENLINGKFYVGYTSQKMNLRWNNHVADSKRDKKRSICLAIRKYGKENFSWSILKTTDSFEEALKLETSYIKKFKSSNRDLGYNLTTGGEGSLSYRHTEQAKRKMRLAKKNYVPWNKNLKYTEEFKQNHFGFQWKITFPSGRKQTIKNLARFCEKHNLNIGHMANIARGGRKQHKNFVCERV